MFSRSHKLFLLIVLSASASCAQNAGSNETAPGKVGVATPVVQATPSKSFGVADIAKLKWIEGTWRGMDGDKPFYERYRLEEAALVVEGLKVEQHSPDDTKVQVESTDRFELKDGEFGKGEGEKRSAASSITADSIQFVPAVPGRGNNFRFERLPDGTWNAVLEWPAAAGKAAKQKIYHMEHWPRQH